MVNVRFLGTGSAGGCPRVGHTDELCRDARRPGSKSARRRSSVLVQTKDATILIDAGPDVLAQLRGARVRSIDAVLLTHEHSDAVGGLRALNSWLAHRGLAVPLIALGGTLDAVYDDDRRQLMSVPADPGTPLMVRRTAVIPFPVIHGVRLDVPTAGYRIDGFVYASDMQGAPPDSLRIMRHAEVFVTDAALWATKSLAGHQTVPEAIAIGKFLAPKRLILTQIGHSVPPHKRAERLVRAYAKRQSVRFPVRLAYDGLKISV
jgi:phosphoribosyl 1,2-cyclic phosphate phosphodiesterase